MPIISRKTSVRAKPKAAPAPIVCDVELLRVTRNSLKLTTQDIADQLGLSRPTVEQALRCDPSTKLYTFLAVCDLLGFEIAEVIPPRERERQVVNAPPMRWSRGPYFKENERTLLKEIEHKELMKKKR